MSADFRKKTFEFDDFGGHNQAKCVGECIGCGSRVYQVRDKKPSGWCEWYDTDPRGVINQDHANSMLIAQDYERVGADVPMCFHCYNEEPRYSIALRLATLQWAEAK